MGTLTLPSKENLREIAAKQETKEAEIHRKREAEQSQAEANPRRDSAQMIQVQHDRQGYRSTDPNLTVDQRNYRGYRERRQIRGHSLSTTTRWTEVSLSNHSLARRED